MSSPIPIQCSSTPSGDDKIIVEVHPVDVGQGDCCFVVFKEVKEDGSDYVIMIDGGVQWQDNSKRVSVSYYQQFSRALTSYYVKE